MAVQHDTQLNDLSVYLSAGVVEPAPSHDTLEHNEAQHEFSLPQADGGKQAWLFLVAAFVVEAFIWGFQFSFGVFQEYYSAHDTFKSDANGIVSIGTTATGIMYMAGLICFPIYRKWPHSRDIGKWCGLPIMAAGLIGSSFASSVNHLIITQGAIYAIGGSLVYYPALLYLDEWFVRRKGLAFGVMWAGTGAGGLFIPLILNVLLEKFGYRTTLRVWAVALVTCSAPLIVFVKPRLPVARTSQAPRLSLGFLKLSTFWVFEIGLIMESLGYFLPGIYLPSYAKSMGLSPFIGSLLVSISNASAVFGTIAMGMLCDRFHVTTVVGLSTVGAMIAVFLFWGLASMLPLLCIFSILYGFFAGGFVSTNVGMIREVQQVDETADSGTLLGIISAGRGIGAVMSGPLSAVLLNSKPWEGKASLAYGSGYGGLIAFTGTTAAVGGVSFFWKKLGWI